MLGGVACSGTAQRDIWRAGAVAGEGIVDRWSYGESLLKIFDAP